MVSISISRALTNKSSLALLCSGRAPAGILLAVHDLAQRWRHGPTALISGFHSPAEQEAFIILLRGPASLVWVPARSRPVRLRPEVRAALAGGWLTIDAPFANTPRATKESAARRNRYVCQQATAVLIAFARPGSRTESLAQELAAADRPFYTVAHAANANLFALGAREYGLGAG